MNVYHYETSGGKDLILEYIDGFRRMKKQKD